MKIVITGALGHIGSRLIREVRIAFPQAEIVMLDNLSTQRYCSLFDLPSLGKYRFVEGDVLTYDLTSIFAGAEFVVHLAAITDVQASFENKDEVERVNFVGTEKVAEACVSTGSKLIFLSTTSVYGTQSKIVDENCSISDLRPQSPYAESKLRSEQLLQSLGGTSELRFVILRFGTIFGTSIGMRFHTAVNKFCWQAVMGQPITVWRTAMHQKRPYLELCDAVRALNFIMKRGRVDNEIYNVLTVNSTVAEILDIIRSQVPNLLIQYVDSPVMNQLSYTVSCAKFHALGFRFKGKLHNGICSMVQLIRNATGGRLR